MKIAIPYKNKTYYLYTRPNNFIIGIERLNKKKDEMELVAEGFYSNIEEALNGLLNIIIEESTVRTLGGLVNEIKEIRSYFAKALKIKVK